MRFTYKKYLLFFIIIVFITACNNEPEQEKAKPASQAIDVPVYKIDLLEKIFNNDNWMKKDGTDTSYYYFSRIEPVINVYHYHINKGDSVNTRLSVIKFSNDSLIWPINDTTHFILTAINETQAKWSRMDSGLQDSIMVFEKKDDKHIKLNLADNKEFLLIKTPALSTFLVRSRYDYLHGTNYAFSDTVFKVKKDKGQLINTRN
jgi:hypothetical protein